MRRLRFSLGRWAGRGEGSLPLRCVSRNVALVAVFGALLVAGGGCGEEGGVADGAEVTAYVVKPLCAGARAELAREDGRAGSVRIRMFCLPGGWSGGELDLAAIGDGARRASEDSTTVGYLEAPGPATRFSAPILESAGIAQVAGDSGNAAMARVLRALRDAGDAASLRAGVADALGGP